MRAVRPLLFVLALTLAACSRDDEAASGVLPPAPSECAALPSLAEVRPRLASSLDAARGTAVALTPKRALTGIVPISAGYVFQKSDGSFDDGRNAAPFLVRSSTELAANENLKQLAGDLVIDWATESLVVTIEARREAIYEYAMDGTTFVALHGWASPCLATADTKDFVAAYPNVMLFAVPSTVTDTRVATTTERYRMSDIKASGVCPRAEGAAVIGGGGSPGLARTSTGGMRMYFNGFSAMTGNVFYGESTDGIAFTPDGWDQGHLSSFEGRGPYADIYSPFVEQVGTTWRMTATALDFVGRSQTNRLVEMTSPDGLAWSAPETLLAATSSEENADDTVPGPKSPARLTVDGEERMYFTRNGSIYLARRRGAGAFVEDPAPALVPPADLDAAGALGYSGPEIVQVGGGYVLFVTTFWGGLSAALPWRSGIGYATSNDGVVFTVVPEPILVPELEDETNGLGDAAALVKADGTTDVFFTSVNRNAEPVIKRATCRLP